MSPRHILIAGPSASGKSTLAQLVAAAARLRLFSLDDYWKGGKAFFATCEHGARVRSYENPGSYDGAKLADDVNSHGGPCVVEGFCLFQFNEVLQLRGSRFYLDLPFQTCLERRSARRPQRPSDSSFKLIGETEMRRWVYPQRSLAGVQVLDGALPPGVLVQQVLTPGLQSA